MIATSFIPPSLFKVIEQEEKKLMLQDVERRQDGDESDDVGRGMAQHQWIALLILLSRPQAPLCLLNYGIIS